ncbi:MAG: hypothetical protein HF300_05700 [Ignavibacteria bacterium]|jgi:peptidoglycan hydrolase CwlO-like protein|nr:hypothetical protein [Ignavibacteria bacterium]MCU7498774.1 hypothetical protein [Ignavibacteria bacterium]MCU7512032.1 hypothetical protein [Ignavibacteria bacterium]MCU7520565.1 hypothetical protein [Ignavibacteria bacterium]MCU7523463.1 hypothetical protein [Ignavibacteria bacterium]
MKLTRKRGRRSRLLLKIALQEQQIAEMRLYIEEMKKLMHERMRGMNCSDN